MDVHGSGGSEPDHRRGVDHRSDQPAVHPGGGQVRHPGGRPRRHRRRRRRDRARPGRTAAFRRRHRLLPDARQPRNLWHGQQLFHPGAPDALPTNAWPQSDLRRHQLQQPDLGQQRAGWHELLVRLQQRPLRHRRSLGDAERGHLRRGIRLRLLDHAAAAVDQQPARQEHARHGSCLRAVPPARHGGEPPGHDVPGLHQRKPGHAECLLRQPAEQQRQILPERP